MPLVDVLQRLKHLLDDEKAAESGELFRQIDPFLLAASGGEWYISEQKRL